MVSTELNSGDFTASITPSGETDPKEVKFTVKKLDIPADGSPALQSFVLNISTDKTSVGYTNPLVPIILTLVGGAVVIGGGIFGFLVYKRKKEEEAILNGQADSDLLASSYGDYASKTQHAPTPNLSAGGMYQPQIEQTTPVADTYSVPNIQQQSVVPPAEYNPQTAQINPIDQPVAQVTPYDTSYNSAPTVESIPLQPTATAMVPPAAPQAYEQYIPPAPIEQTYTPPVTEYPVATGTSADTPSEQPLVPENIPELTMEEYSQAVTSVESAETTPNSDEPSAVYDEATGELSIVHHHAKPGGMGAAGAI
jgi:hypothetical protein